MIDPVHARGRKPLNKADRVVTMSITVPLWLKLAMMRLSAEKQTSVSKLTARCYTRLAEFHQYKKSDLMETR
jgi:hypothetical protein